MHEAPEPAPAAASPATATDTDAGQTPDRGGYWREVLAVGLLSVMAVLTAWCGFQSSKWGGEMSIAFSQASSARVQATNMEGQARDQRQEDLTVYGLWIEATAVGDEALANYVEARFSTTLRTAFDAWQADGMVEASPFVREEYVPEGAEAAATLNATADERFQTALTNNQRGDDYSLLTVLFALVLFFAAMSQRKIRQWASWTFLGLGLTAGIIGIAVMLALPIKI